VRFAERLGDCQDVLREGDDDHPEAPACLLKEVVAFRDEVLKLVHPKQYRVGRVGQVSAQPCSLEYEFQHHVDEPARLVPVFQQRKIADYDLVFMGGHLGRQGAFPARKQPTVWRIEESVAHA
jgi:hypothetical protein